MANLAYRIRQTPEKMILVELSGFVNASTSRFFEEILDKLVDKGENRVLLDMYKVNYMNSTGIGILFNYSETFRERGGGMVVIRVPQEVGVTMQLLGLTDVVPCMKSREDGVKYLQGLGKPKPPEEKETVSAKAGDKKPPHKRSPVYFFRTRDFKPVPETASVVLLVPKETLFTDIVKMRLHGAKGKVHIVHTASEALDLIDKIRPEVLMLEDRVTDAEEFLQKVKVEKGRSLMSVIKIYPTGTKTDSLRNFRIWENDYLVEPFEMMELFALAEAELRRIPKDRKNYLQQVHFRFRTDLPNMTRAFDLMTGLIAKVGLPPEQATALAAAYREGVDNAYRHGHARSEDKVVDTVFLLEPSQVSITIEDEGKGFDYKPHLARAKSLSPGEQAKLKRDAGQRGGLGIMLMARSTDSLEYLGKGNVARLVKKLTGYV